jgi:hypothetical protein
MGKKEKNLEMFVPVSMSLSTIRQGILENNYDPIVLAEFAYSLGDNGEYDMELNFVRMFARDFIKDSKIDASSAGVINALKNLMGEMEKVGI